MVMNKIAMPTLQEQAEYKAQLDAEKEDEEEVNTYLNNYMSTKDSGNVAET